MRTVNNNVTTLDQDLTRPHPIMVPAVKGEKLPQGAYRRAGGQGDRFDALARQIAQPPTTISFKMRERWPRQKTGPKASGKIRQRRPKSGNLFFRHRRPPCLMNGSSDESPKILSQISAVVLIANCGLLSQVLLHRPFTSQ